MDITLSQLRDYVVYTDHYPYTPEQYLLKLMEELGELGEAWLSGRRMEDGQIKGTLEEELWDVLYYIWQAALSTGSDLPLAIVLRERENCIRFGRSGLEEYLEKTGDDLQRMPETVTLSQLQRYVASLPHPQTSVEADLIHLFKEGGCLCQAYTRASEHGMAEYRLASAGRTDGTLEGRLWDSMFYLIRIANACGADLVRCAVIKEELGAERFGRLGIPAFIKQNKKEVSI